MKKGLLIASMLLIFLLGIKSVVAATSYYYLPGGKEYLQNDYSLLCTYSSNSSLGSNVIDSTNKSQGYITVVFSSNYVSIYDADATVSDYAPEDSDLIVKFTTTKGTNGSVYSVSGTGAKYFSQGSDPIYYRPAGASAGTQEKFYLPLSDKLYFESSGVNTAGETMCPSFLSMLDDDAFKEYATKMTKIQLTNAIDANDVLHYGLKDDGEVIFKDDGNWDTDNWYFSFDEYEDSLSTKPATSDINSGYSDTTAGDYNTTYGDVRGVTTETIANCKYTFYVEESSLEDNCYSTDVTLVFSLLNGTGVDENLKEVTYNNVYQVKVSGYDSTFTVPGLDDKGFLPDDLRKLFITESNGKYTCVAKENIYFFNASSSFTTGGISREVLPVGSNGYNLRCANGGKCYPTENKSVCKGPITPDVIDKATGEPISCNDFIYYVDKDGKVVSKDKGTPVNLISELFNIMMIAGPILALVLGGVDFAKATLASDESALKKAGTNFGKRIVAAILLFLLPLIINLIIGIAFSAGTFEGMENVPDVCLTQK